MTSQSASVYKRYEQKEHIYKIPDTYVGSDEQIERSSYLLHFNDQNKPESITRENITLPEAIERFFLEIISNAADNVDKSRKHGVDPGSINVEMDKHWIVVTNGGIPIPVEKHEEEGRWAPDLIFGVLLTSSNYDKEVERTGCGRNGYGAKLVNIFSKHFSVEVGDAERGLRYFQTWTENMENTQDPQITSHTSKKSFVRISWYLDFERFGYPVSEGYPKEAFLLFAKHTADQSLTCKVPVTFNGVRLNFSSISKYAQLYFPGCNTIVHEDNNVELALVDSPSEALMVSFVNGMPTMDGGVHVDEAYRAAAYPVLETINSSKAAGNMKLTLRDVKPHLSLFLSCHLSNPKFKGQTKTVLTSPKPKIRIDSKKISRIKNWEFVRQLYAALEAKAERKKSKSDGSKRRFAGVDKAEDANLAGTKRSQECTLFIVEGNSAMSYPTKAISLNPETGRDLYGSYPMKGKPLNVLNASPHKIAENEEIIELKRMLGLKEGVDYTQEKNFRTLRYGEVMILADSDDDGKHIMGLILNLFAWLYPSLLQRGFVKFLRTPIVRAVKGNTTKRFFTEHSYLQWREQEPNPDSWKIKYFKGLGSSSDKDIEDDFQNPKFVQCVYDKKAPQYLRLAFDKKLSNNRKVWIAKHKSTINIEDLEFEDISTFINEEFIEYSIYDLARNIPQLLDGLKLSQRKALWGAMERWKKQGGGYKSGTSAEQVKVARLAAYISERTAYKHGETCLSDTIVNMTFDFPGANNIPYFMQDGQFGTRNRKGKDAANTRYSYTRLSPLLPYIYREEDLPLLELTEDEGKKREPVVFLPILPMILVNGCTAIGTGHSTYIPNCNPLDLCSWLRARLNGEKTPEIQPWYRGFRGKISVQEKTNKDIAEEEGEEETSENEEPNEHVGFNSKAQKHLSMAVEGRIYQKSEGKAVTSNDEIIIDEIPLGKSIHEYRNFLKSLIESKDILDLQDKSTSNRPYFIIKAPKNATMNLRTMRLLKNFGMSNMVLLDKNNKPHKYSTLQSILEAFYRHRLGYYRKRKESILSRYEASISTKKQKKEVIKAIMRGDLHLFNVRQKKIQERMKQLGFDPALLSKINLSHCSQEQIQGIEDEIAKEESAKEAIANTQPEEFWKRDLNEFEKAYRRMYKD
jgi:DNA topoisomerase-2